MNRLQYRNPVWPEYFADPFVMRIGSAYYAYGTAPAQTDGREFPILRSPDLVHWKSVGGALTPLPLGRPGTYWAPELAARNGKFFLYYSVSSSGSDEDQHLRVAIADDPAGPFVDSGKPLMPGQGFCIDASPFLDPRDGRWYLFFAMDYDQDEPIGTGICVVPLMDDMTQVEESRQMVVRATSPWQVYETNRRYKGRIWPVWNCVEGPSVVHHDGHYYCFYSGGAWHGDNYGVAFVVAQHPMGPWHEPQAGGGPTVLKGIPGKVIGPGHNSVVMGPDGKTLFMVYHAWDPGHTARRMCIDPLLWTPEGPRVDGPTNQLVEL